MLLQHTVDRVEGSARLVDYLKARLVLVPVTEVGDLVTGGHVRLLGRPRAAEPGAAPPAAGRTIDVVRSGDVLAIEREALARLEASGRWNPPWDEPVAIAYEDEHLLVAEKPAGIHVHPLGDRRERTLLGALLHRACLGQAPPFGVWRPHVVSRLDCVVSGLVLVAKDAASKDALVRAQKRHALHRTYEALVEGLVPGDAGTIDLPVGREPGRGWRRAPLPVEAGGLAAVTDWRVLERGRQWTLLQVEPRTGRTHQIRVHLAAMGHPIVGDALYGASGPATEAERTGIVRLGGRPVVPIALHAAALRFTHPADGRIVEVVSPRPPRLSGPGPSFC